TNYRHHQVSHAARAGRFPWVFLLGSEGWMIDGKRSVVIAVFAKLTLLPTCIQIGWQLGRRRLPRPFMIAFRGGLLAEAIVGGGAPPTGVGLSKQPSKFFNTIAFSVDLECVLSHWIDRISTQRIR